MRKEHDSMGEIEVADDALWGAQTERSLHHFAIGHDTLPRSMIRAFGIVKKAAAETNCELKNLSDDKAKLIIDAASQVIEGEHDDHFPLRIWQTGSGTQSNMNTNEVIANLTEKKVHPNDDVNMSQSSNDTFPTAMHIAASEELNHTLLPSLTYLIGSLIAKKEAFESIVKIGRTHLMDAVPITFGQQFSGYIEQLTQAKSHIESALPYLYQLALGGTAVGTGLNTHPQFAQNVAKKIGEQTSLPFVSSPNKFASLASHDPIVYTSGTLKTLAVALMKIATDFAFLGSGPRCGLAELQLPANEPGSSIMPGKVNPTQCEALNMVCAQVMGNDTAISVGGSRGNFELNVFKPMMIHNLLHSITLLSDSMKAFATFCVKDLKVNENQVNEYLSRSLLLITALNPIIGYDNGAKVVKKAFNENKSLKEAALELGVISEEEFDKAIDPKKMLGPS